jgi:O-antigen/teichoic acid export membrane protein
MNLKWIISKSKAFLFTNTSSKQTVIKNTFWLMLAEWVSKGSIALITILIGRQFGTEIFGIYSYRWVILTFLIIFADLGLTTLLIRDYQHLELSQRYYYLSKWLQTKWILSLIVVSIFLLILYFTTDEVFIRQIWLVLLVYQLGNSFLEYLRGTFRSLQTSEVEFSIKLIQWTGNMALIPFIYIFENVILIIVLQTVIICITSLYTIYIVKKWQKIINKNTSLLTNKIWLIRQGRLFAMSWLFLFWYYYVDTIFIKLFFWYDQVWIYNAIYQITIYMMTPLVILWKVLFPKFSKWESWSHKVAVKLTYKIAIFYIFISITTFIFANELIITLYWPQYIKGLNALRILVFSPALLAWYIILSTYLSWNWHEKLNLKFLIEAFIINLFLNFILIKDYWIEWAWISTIICEIWILLRYINCFVTNFNSKKL